MFKAYCEEIEQTITKEGYAIPEIIVKVMGQCELYRCRQYNVTVYQKNVVKKELVGIEEEMVLGVKRGKALLMNKKKEVVLTIQYGKVKEMSVYATSIIFVLEHIKT